MEQFEEPEEPVDFVVEGGSGFFLSWGFGDMLLARENYVVCFVLVIPHQKKVLKRTGSKKGQIKRVFFFGGYIFFMFFLGMYSQYHGGVVDKIGTSHFVSRSASAWVLLYSWLLPSGCVLVNATTFVTVLSCSFGALVGCIGFFYLAKNIFPKRPKMAQQITRSSLLNQLIVLASSGLSSPFS